MNTLRIDSVSWRLVGLVVFGISSVSWAAMARADDEVYRIKFTGQNKVGESCRVHITGTSYLGQFEKNDGRVVEQKQTFLKADITAVIEILAMNAAGDVTRRRITFEKFALSKNDGEAVEGFPAGGVVITKKKDSETVYLPRNKAHKLSEDAQRILESANSAIGTFGPVHEELYPVPGPQKVGASWLGDRKRYIKDLETPDFKLEELSAHATLRAVKVVDGEKYLNVELCLSTKGRCSESEANYDPLVITTKTATGTVFSTEVPGAWLESRIEADFKGESRGKPGTAAQGVEFFYHTIEEFKVTRLNKD